MYVRPIRVDELIEWLESIDYEALVTEELAKVMVDKFDIITQARNP